jgi:hypothetical protein
MRQSALFAGLLLFGGVAFAQDAAQTKSAPATAAQTPVARPKPPHGAKLTILAPKNGATVGPDVTVTFGVKHIKVAPATDTSPNTGHHHLLIDVISLPPGDAPIPNDATHKHYGKGQTEDTIHLEPGTHTLQLDFGDAAHMQFDPPLVSRKITIHVK